MHELRDPGFFRLIGSRIWLPACPSTREVIKRRQTACKIIRQSRIDVHRRNQPDLLGHGRQRGELLLDRDGFPAPIVGVVNPAFSAVRATVTRSAVVIGSDIISPSPNTWRTPINIPFSFC